MKESTFITRVVLRNYKSIAACDVELRPLTFLVGPNGAGKSNFLDALRFAADSLRTSLDGALRDRGGLKEVRRRAPGQPKHFSIRLDFALDGGNTGYYAFRIGGRKGNGYQVLEEACSLPDINDPSRHAYFHLKNGTVTTNITPAPSVAPERLYLVNASGFPQFHSVYESLSRMAFYNLSPDAIRALQPSDLGWGLARDGGNLASLLATIAPSTKERIQQYLAEIAPGICGVAVVKAVRTMRTLEFRQRREGSDRPQRFLAANMSDGTLRALGILVAVFQSNGDSSHQWHVPLVGIEEPELALHPAVAGVLLDSLREASENTQILVTSHSAELLDDANIEPESILAVEAESGVTHIGPLNDAGRSVLLDGLYTAGELLRLNQLFPHPDAISSAKAKTGRIFERHSE